MRNFQPSFIEKQLSRLARLNSRDKELLWVYRKFTINNLKANIVSGHKMQQSEIESPLIISDGKAEKCDIIFNLLVWQLIVDCNMVPGLSVTNYL